MIQIDYLKDRPEFISPLAHGMSAHWRNIIPGENYERRVDKLNAHLNHDHIPTAWVAHTDGKPLGSSALRVCDLTGREDLTPWLASVFVFREHRGQGIASQLCIVAEKQAWHWGINRLYLHTPDQQSLYSQLGWQAFGIENWHGVKTEIMVKDRPV